MDPIFHLLPDAPKPVAPYSHAVEAGPFVFVTGQLATDPDDDSLPIPPGIEAQTRKVMDNLARVLRGCGMTLRQRRFCPDLPDRFQARLRGHECDLLELFRFRRPAARPDHGRRHRSRARRYCRDRHDCLQTVRDCHDGNASSKFRRGAARPPSSRPDRSSPSSIPMASRSSTPGPSTAPISASSCRTSIPAPTACIWFRSPATCCGPTSAGRS